MAELVCKFWNKNGESDFILTKGNGYVHSPYRDVWVSVKFDRTIAMNKVVVFDDNDPFNEHLLYNNHPKFFEVNINNIEFDESKVEKYEPKVYVEKVPPSWEFCLHYNNHYGTVGIVSRLKELGFKCNTNHYGLAVDKFIIVKNGEFDSSKHDNGLVEWMPEYFDFKFNEYLEKQE